MAKSGQSKQKSDLLTSEIMLNRGEIYQIYTSILTINRNIIFIKNQNNWINET